VFPFVLAGKELPILEPLIGPVAAGDFKDIQWAIRKLKRSITTYEAGYRFRESTRISAARIRRQ
jgi:protein gp37